ncbi:MAG: inositol monophosphatase [Synergistales bacterium]|nr:inositol monophosphatase [Synergistales bacterium]
MAMVEIGDLKEIVLRASKLMTREDMPRIARQRSFTDYTTATDIAVEDQIRKELKERYPSSLLVAEESSSLEYGEDWARSAFVLDPIDGTINFFHHLGTSAVSLAYVENGEVLHGIIYDPYREELFSATRGEGAYMNGHAVKTSLTCDLGNSLVGFGTSPYSKEKGLEMLRVAADVYLNCQDLRRLGAAAIDLAYVACGRLDAFFEKDLKPWDFYAGMLIISEAGGIISDWEGLPVRGLEKQDILAASPALHKKMLSLLEGYTGKGHFSEI